MKLSVLIAAAGKGTRMGMGKNKTLLPVDGVPMLARSVSVFESMPETDEIIVITGAEDLEETRRLVSEYGFKKVTRVVVGGSTRQESVENGLAAGTGDVVAIHDGARPYVTPDVIRAAVEGALRCGAAVPCVSVTDTIKFASGGFVKCTPDRSALYAAQTPQTFKTDLLRRAYEHARAEGLSFTDDVSAVEAMGGKVEITPGSRENVKITNPEDLKPAERCPRVGFGLDVHKLVEGRRFILGGVDISHDKGLLGHSDADVLLHAVCDALLGAAALGDIGKHFPDTDPRYKGIDSGLLLKHVADLVKSKGFEIANIDATVSCQKPKLAPHIEDMRRNIAAACEIDFFKISVKATTTEHLGYEGRGEGVTAQAVCLIR